MIPFDFQGFIDSIPCNTLEVSRKTRIANTSLYRFRTNKEISPWCLRILIDHYPEIDINKFKIKREEK